jgi:hypothetical protein
MAARTKKFENFSERQIAAPAEPGLEQPSLNGSITRIIGWPVEAWLRCQEGVLKATEPAATGWIERRREGANAVFSTFEKLARCGDLQEAVSIQRDWLEGTMRRLDSDLHALADQAVALSHEAVAATRYVAQTSTEMVTLTTQAAGRSDEVVEQAA